MSYEIVFTARARRDLLAMRRWLSQPGSGLKAQLKISRVSRGIAELQFVPLRWSVGAHDGARERLIDGYRIIYRVEDDAGVTRILRVFGPYQDQSTL